MSIGSLAGTGAGWEAALYDATEMRALVLDARAAPVPTGAWLPVGAARMVLLTLCPPADARAGTVEVHVTQRSTGQEAVVEFSLDPAAAGRGCYVVSSIPVVLIQFEPSSLPSP